MVRTRFTVGLVITSGLIWLNPLPAAEIHTEPSVWATNAAPAAPQRLPTTTPVSHQLIIPDAVPPNRAPATQSRSLAAVVPSDATHLVDSETPVPPSPDAWRDPTSPLGVVNRRVERDVARAARLAERGALYSARAELVESLTAIARMLDGLAGKSHYGSCLRNGLTALREMDDFASVDSAMAGSDNWQQLVQRHRTPVLKDRTSLPDMARAMRAYADHAEQQLVIACGQAPAAADALCVMAKTHLLLADQSPSADQTSGLKALVLYRVACMTDPDNGLAANELGVLLARYGQWAAARDVLQRAVRRRPLPETWHNLAIVHRQLGEERLADLADAQWRSSGGLAAGTTQGQAPPIEWVPPSQLAGPPPLSHGTTAALPHAHPMGREQGGTR